MHAAASTMIIGHLVLPFLRFNHQAEHARGELLVMLIAFILSLLDPHRRRVVRRSTVATMVGIELAVKLYLLNHHPRSMRKLTAIT
jgi:hypothetical protein